MSGGTIVTDPNELARHCDLFRLGAEKMFNSGGPNDGDMWFFELYHHLTDCANALRQTARRPATRAPTVNLRS